MLTVVTFVTVTFCTTGTAAGMIGIARSTTPSPSVSTRIESNWPSPVVSMRCSLMIKLIVAHARQHSVSL